jgi:hypothetical protein
VPPGWQFLGSAAQHFLRTVNWGTCQVSGIVARQRSTYANRLWQRMHLFLELGEHGLLAMGSDPACDMDLLDQASPSSKDISGTNNAS